jgi:hypothetical protein
VIIVYTLAATIIDEDRRVATRPASRGASHFFRSFDIMLETLPSSIPELFIRMHTHTYSRLTSTQMTRRGDL